MDIPLIVNWEEKFKAGYVKVYPLGPKDRKIIDTEFNKFHHSGCIDWSGLTPFTYPCFVVWTIKANGTCKRCTIVDIRSLNKITLPDAYLMPSQANILAK